MFITHSYIQVNDIVSLNHLDLHWILLELVLLSNKQKNYFLVEDGDKSVVSGENIKGSSRNLSQQEIILLSKNVMC